MQPLSAVAVAVVAIALALRSPDRARSVGWIVAGALPAVLLAVAAHHVATGRVLGVSSAVHAALGDSAAVSRSGALSLLSTAVRRVRSNMLDVANFEPLALLPLVALVGARRCAAARAPALVIVGQVLVYAFVADPGVAPGSGAGPLVDVLPVEQALMALALARAFPRALGRAATAVLSLSMAGFAVHAARGHEILAASGLGRPHFEPDALREANVSAGLLFLDDDEAFALAHEPGVPASHGLVAARARGDDHDRLLFDVLGHPQSHRYFPGGATSPVVSPWVPAAEGSETWRFEAESDWPPDAVVGGSAKATEPPGACASAGRALVLTPAPNAEAIVTLALPVPRGTTAPERRSWLVTPRVVELGTHGEGSVALVASAGGPPLARWAWTDTARQPTCVDLDSQRVDLGGDRPRAWLVVTVRGGAVALDRTLLQGR